MLIKGGKFSLILISICLSVSLGKAQSQEIDFQTWSDFTLGYNIKNKANIGADLGIRGLISRNEWNQFYIRPAFKYYFNNVFQVSGGVAYFATLSGKYRNTYEFRLFQEATIMWPSFEIINFQHRLRFEERFFNYQQNSTYTTDIPNDFESRVRYQFSLESADIHFGDENRPIYFMAGWEFFYALNENAIEQIINGQRVSVGFGHRLSPRYRYQFQYIFQRSREFIEEGLQTTEHILRLRFYLFPRAPQYTD